MISKRLQASLDGAVCIRDIFEEGKKLAAIYGKENIFNFSIGNPNVAPPAIVNETLKIIDKFDLSTFVLKPENVQDIIQEVYMELIPSEMRHLMGEYFLPGWIVEHVLDMAEYDGDINKTLIDPCAGSGPFLTQAIKRIIKNKNGVLTKQDIKKITKNQK